MRLSNIIVKPLITEKSVELVSQDKYAFKVSLNAKKETIRQELKRIYGVTALDVNTMIIPGKKRRVTGTKNFTKSSKWKKAVVKLAEGQSIDVFPKE